MGYLSSQLSITNSLPIIRSARFFGNRLRRLDSSLLIETALVAIAAILAIRIFDGSSISRAAWFVAPGIWVAAALIPTAVKKSKFAMIGFTTKQIGLALLLVFWTCVVVFPAMFCGLWLLRSYGLELPLRAVPLQNQEWVFWLFYQFMYVAVAEEVFFRGYVQGNILRLTNMVRGEESRLTQWISIVISAAVFAVAHIIVQGQTISVITFLPGLVLGWLFSRTGSLLAPILFHGLANACYLVMAAVFT